MMSSYTSMKLEVYDNYATTPDSWKLIAHLLPKGAVVWEAAYLENSPGPDGLSALGLDVIHDQIDFLSQEPARPYDFIVTNPPFSNKGVWIKRAIALKKPFIFLMPFSSLSTRGFVDEYADDPNMQVLLTRRRLSFLKFDGGVMAPNEEQLLCPFDTAFYCYRFNLPSKIDFCPDVLTRQAYPFKRHRDRAREARRKKKKVV